VWTRLLVSCEEGEEEEERGGAPEDRRLTYYCGTRGDRERRIARNQNRGRLIQVLSLLLSISKSICLVFLLSFDVIFELGFGHFGGYYWLREWCRFLAGVRGENCHPC
jgi:hypothetical protein